MKGNDVQTSWRTVQLFISAQAAGIFEVEVDTETKKLRCSCPKWKKFFSCKHVRFVHDRMIVNGGHYSVLIPQEVSEDLAFEANDDAAKFREFVVKYAKIEVL
jgi:hypothetical protein